MKANDIAPFVLKTYKMVNDQTTANLITWGKANNSFIVLDPLEFSKKILPSFFKHDNFSSFVRQLNTYLMMNQGFKKVDTDRWEFANQWFLRGQKQLLINVVRKKHDSFLQVKKEELDEDDGEIEMEISRLKKAQKDLEEEIECMKKRLEVTEKSPNQLISFLRNVVNDPELDLNRILTGENLRKHQQREKKRRLMKSPSIPEPVPSIKIEQVEEELLDIIDVFPPSPEMFPPWIDVESAVVEKYTAASPLENYGELTNWLSDTVFTVEASPAWTNPFSLSGDYCLL